MLMARVVGYSGEVLHRYELESAAYSIYRLDITSDDQRVPLPGHQDVALDLDDVFFDSLQNDETWTADDEGFNFRHVLDNMRSEIFSLSHRFYQVEYVFYTRNSSRPPIRVQFRLFSV